MSRAFGAMAILLTVMVTFAQAVDKAAVKCSTGKQKAAVKKIGSKLKCHQKANAAGLPVDQACLAKAEAKFSDTVTKIDAKGGCIVVGDEAVIEQAVDVCVDAIRGLTPANPPTCGDGPYPQCGGTCPAGQACRPVLETKLTDGMGNGDGPTESCGTVCNCVDPALACDGAPCASLCMRDIHERNTPPYSVVTEICCSGRGGHCGGSIRDGENCCCAGACSEPPLSTQDGRCLSGPSCSGTQQVCG
jgi:hypothetical protein